MSFEDELDADLDAQLAAEPYFGFVSVLINGKHRKLRFTEMDGLAWADICNRNPPRLVDGADPAKPKQADILPIDLAYGHNVLGASVQAASVSGHMQSGDDWVELSPERWKKLIRGLPGAQLREIADVIWNLNQWAPSQAVLSARKASAVESALSSYSPAPSESPAAN